MATDVSDVKRSLDKQPLLFSQAPRYDFMLSFAALKNAADSGDASSQYLVGMSYYRGWKNCIIDKELGSRYILLAAQQANTPAGICAQGQCFKFGLGNVVIKNLEKAKEYFVKAVDEGYIPATEVLANTLYDEAVTTTTSTGDLSGYTGEGTYSHTSTHTQKDNEKLKTVIGLYIRGAEAGYSPSQCSLGECYYEGDGVPKDYVEAMKLFKLAAQTGDAMAKNNIGSMYFNGYGVTSDTFEGARWWKLSAAQNCEAAKNNLKTQFGMFESCCTIL